MNKQIIEFGIGAIFLAILVSLVYFLFLRSGTSPAVPNPEVDAPANVGDGINDAVDSQIEEIANDVANAAREGYISRREYMSPDPAQSVEDLTRIVLKNIVGKPIKAMVSRDDSSRILKVLMTGVDPNVFKPSVSTISDCVSDKIKTTKQKSRPDIATYTYDCTNDYFSENNLEFEKIVPAALTMYENAFNKYAPESDKEEVKQSGGLKKAVTCSLINGTDEGAEFESCMNGSETPKITWERAQPIMANFFRPPSRSDFR